MSGRDAAFLAEMGIGPLWRLRAAPAAAPEADDALAAHACAPPAGETQAAGRDATGAETANAEPAAAATGGAAPGTPGMAGDVSHMGWSELRAAVAACTRCSACRDGAPRVFGAGAEKARWLVAAGTASAADEQAGAPLAGDAGRLLDNMLAAVDLSRERDVWVTSLIKCRPASASGGDRAPTAEEATACRPFLERELALTGAGTVLTLGQIAANGLLGKPLQEPLAGTRGTVHALDGVPLVATLHPAELLRRGADKALAWADLCRAKAADGRRD